MSGKNNGESGFPTSVNSTSERISSDKVGNGGFFPTQGILPFEDLISGNNSSQTPSRTTGKGLYRRTQKPDKPAKTDNVDRDEIVEVKV
jgi:hypothetical protein